MSTSTTEEATRVTSLAADDGPDDATQQVIDEIHAHAEAEAGASEDNEFGRVGRRFDRRAPFFLGFAGAMGAACAFALVYAIVAAGQVLVLSGLAFFLAVGLDTPVRWLHGRGLARGWAVAVVLVVTVAVVAAFLAFAVSIAVSQAGHLANEIPHYLRQLDNPHTAIGRLNARYHVITRLQKVLHGQGTSVSTVVGAGKVALDLIASVVLVATLTAYVLSDLPRVKRGMYHLAPRSRRARVVLLVDEMLVRVGGYILGNIFTSAVAGAGTIVWALAFGIPYAIFLGLVVAVLDLVPIVGSTIGGVIVSLVALTVSVPLAIATAAFYIAYRLLEDYLLTPRVMSHTVAVPGLVTILATLIGGALLGIVGALVAIPVAAAIKLLLDQVASPRLERS